MHINRDSFQKDTLLLSYSRGDMTGETLLFLHWSVLRYWAILLLQTSGKMPKTFIKVFVLVRFVLQAFMQTNTIPATEIHLIFSSRSTIFFLRNEQNCQKYFLSQKKSLIRSFIHIDTKSEGHLLWAESHPPSDFRENPSTNPQTDTAENIRYLTE